MGHVGNPRSFRLTHKRRGVPLPNLQNIMEHRVRAWASVDKQRSFSLPVSSISKKHARNRRWVRANFSHLWRDYFVDVRDEFFHKTPSWGQLWYARPYKGSYVNHAFSSFKATSIFSSERSFLRFTGKKSDNALVGGYLSHNTFMVKPDGSVINKPVYVSKYLREVRSHLNPLLNDRSEIKGTKYDVTEDETDEEEEELELQPHVSTSENDNNVYEIMAELLTKYLYLFEDTIEHNKAILFPKYNRFGIPENRAIMSVDHIEGEEAETSLEVPLNPYFFFSETIPAEGVYETAIKEKYKYSFMEEETIDYLLNPFEAFADSSEDVNCFRRITDALASRRDYIFAKRSLASTSLRTLNENLAKSTTECAKKLNNKARAYRSSDLERAEKEKKRSSLSIAARLRKQEYVSLGFERPSRFNVEAKGRKIGKLVKALITAGKPPARPHKEEVKPQSISKKKIFSFKELRK